MSETNPNNPDSGRENASGNKAPDKYELLSAYLDNEIKSEKEKDNIRKKIESDPDMYNRFVFEDLSKKILKTRIKEIETPPYLYKNISQSIDDYINQNSVRKPLSTLSATVPNQIYSDHIENEKSNLKRYLIYGSYALIALVIFSFIVNYYFLSNPEISNYAENDIVSVSRTVFKEIESGDVGPQFKSNCAKVLEDSMNKYVDFKVFVPEVKDAELIGGVCNEINGEKLAHFIHKKGNVIIYTLQANLKDVMNNHDKIIMCKDFKENVQKGKNWFPCPNDKTTTAVIWFKDNVICSSVSHLASNDIFAILTNYK